MVEDERRDEPEEPDLNDAPPRILYAPPEGEDPDKRFLLAATEALIFASTEPLTANQHAAALGDGVKGRLAEFVAELNAEYEQQGRAFEILAVAGGYQFFTRRDFSGVLRKLFMERARARLSRAALETLAVVAFRGPVTRAEIDEIRGVDSGGVLRTLLDRHLVAVRGRAKVIGRPLLYETTPEFLKHFGLSDLSELPRDSELLREWGQPRAIDESPVEEPPPADDGGEILELSLTNAQTNGRPDIPPVEETDSEKDIGHDVA
ncbi:MAG TPA: SMC-Scp complex subunit ScpB [bacterium]|jgi:segregation and condensation protein B